MSTGRENAITPDWNFVKRGNLIREGIGFDDAAAAAHRRVVSAPRNFLSARLFGFARPRELIPRREAEERRSGGKTLF